MNTKPVNLLLLTSLLESMEDDDERQATEKRIQILKHRTYTHHYTITDMFGVPYFCMGSDKPISEEANTLHTQKMFSTFLDNNVVKTAYPN